MDGEQKGHGRTGAVMSLLLLLLALRVRATCARTNGLIRVVGLSSRYNNNDEGWPRLLPIYMYVYIVRSKCYHCWTKTKGSQKLNGWHTLFLLVDFNLCRADPTQPKPYTALAYTSIPNHPPYTTTTAHSCTQLRRGQDPRLLPFGVEIEETPVVFALRRSCIELSMVIVGRVYFSLLWGWKIENISSLFEFFR